MVGLPVCGDTDRGAASVSANVKRPAAIAFLENEEARGSLLMTPCWGCQMERTARFFKAINPRTPVNESSQVAGSGTGVVDGAVTVAE